MINPDMIPIEVKLRLRNVLSDGETDEAVALAAALNAWPDMECRPTFGPNRIILPLKDVQNTER